MFRMGFAKGELGLITIINIGAREKKYKLNNLYKLSIYGSPASSLNKKRKNTPFSIVHLFQKFCVFLTRFM